MVPSSSGSILSTRRLNRATLARQGLLERFDGEPADTVRRLAGLQAQHANSPFIALWSRQRDLRIADLEAALEARTVVKATVMRSTLHLVAAEDYPAFDVASSQARVANWRATTERAGLNATDLHRRLLTYAREPRTIDELEAYIAEITSDTALEKYAPDAVQRVMFRIASAAGGLVLIPPAGFWKEHRRGRYVAAEAWLPDYESHEPEAALRIAIERYLTAYGPASIADIGKWVGQPRLPMVKAAIDALGDRIRPFRGEDDRDLVNLADIDARSLPDEDADAPPRFLARWDSALIGYDARDRILPKAYREAVVKKNGDFLPSFLVDGFVAGLWSTARDGEGATLTLSPFAKVKPTDRRALEAEGDRLVRFVEPEASAYDVSWTEPG